MKSHQVSLSEELRKDICDSAVHLMKNVNYINAGTVEFLVSGDYFYFIEVNPRVQVEHTVTEMITGIDIVQTQILIAEGYELHGKKLYSEQDEIQISGFAIQSRVTTEDPLNNFMPDTGKLWRIVQVVDLVFVWMPEMHIKVSDYTLL